MQKEENQNKLTTSQIEDLHLAAKKMKGAARRAFQAEMCLTYNLFRQNFPVLIYMIFFFYTLFFNDIYIDRLIILG